MKKKSVIWIAVALSVFVLITNIVVCAIYSLFEQGNSIYLLGLIVLPLLPYVLLLSIPTYGIKTESDEITDKNTTKK